VDTRPDVLRFAPRRRDHVPRSRRRGLPAVREHPADDRGVVAGTADRRRAADRPPVRPESRRPDSGRRWRGRVHFGQFIPWHPLRRRRWFPFNGPCCARPAVRRHVVRRPFPDRGYPGRSGFHRGAPVLLRPAVEPGPAGARAPATRWRVAHRLAGTRRLRPGVGRSGRACQTHRGRCSLRDRVAVGVSVPPAPNTPHAGGPGPAGGRLGTRDAPAA
jgi:hypothetical protein